MLLAWPDYNGKKEKQTDLRYNQMYKEWNSVIGYGKESVIKDNTK